MFVIIVDELTKANSKQLRCLAINKYKSCLKRVLGHLVISFDLIHLKCCNSILSLDAVLGMAIRFNHL